MLDQLLQSMFYLNGNPSQNISKVHMKDRADFSLFAKFQRPNQFS